MTGSTASRHTILARIRATTATITAPPIPRDYRQRDDDESETGGDRLELFIDRLIDYRADVSRCQPDQVAESVSTVLQAEAARTVVMAQGFPPEWSPSAADVDVVVDGAGDNGSKVLSTVELDDVDAVVTTCATAIAETGTIVLDGGPGQGRRAITLLPDLHVVVLTVNQLVSRVPDALPVVDARRPLTWISGPSATSDIELNRVEGVHGPRRLRVIIVD